MKIRRLRPSSTVKIHERQVLEGQVMAPRRVTNRWPPERFWKGDTRSPWAYCAPKRCYCGKCPHYEPIPGRKA